MSFATVTRVARMPRSRATAAFKAVKEQLAEAEEVERLRQAKLAQLKQQAKQLLQRHLSADELAEQRRRAAMKRKTYEKNTTKERLSVKGPFRPEAPVLEEPPSSQYERMLEESNVAMMSEFGAVKDAAPPPVIDVQSLPRMPSVRDLIKLYGLTARSYLSQNFLLDLNVTDKVVRSAGNMQRAVVVEVGPGPGSLTRSLLANGAGLVFAIEKDARFFPSLQILADAVRGRLFMTHSDVLDVDAGDLVKVIRHMAPFEPEALHLVGNLPFSVATPLLVKWLRDLSAGQGFFSKESWPATMTLMFQKEVGQRIVAPPDDPARGRLSVLAQRICNTSCVFDVPGTSFVPPPEVDATVVRLVPRPDPIPVDSPEVLEDVLKRLFHYRRKTIQHSLRVFMPDAADLLKQMGLDPTARPQSLTTEEWCVLANTCSRLGWQVNQT